MAAASGNGAGELRDLLALARQLGATPADLDEIVHEIVGRRATEINNSGLEAQLSYLINIIGADQGPPAAAGRPRPTRRSVCPMTQTHKERRP